MLSFNPHQMDRMLLHPFLLFLISKFLLHVVTKRIYKPCYDDRRLPPSPPKLPILGNLHQLGVLSHRSLQSLGRKYGPFLLLYFGRKPVVIIQSANVAVEIMKTKDLIFADRPNSRTTNKLFYNSKNISVAPYGDYWRKMKSMCILQLLNTKRVQFFHSIREEETALLMESIKSFSLSCLPVNLSELFMSVTNDLVCRTTFGRKYSEGEFGKRFPMLLKELLQLLGSVDIGEYIPYLSWIDRVIGFDARVDKIAKELDDFLEMIIQEHLSADKKSGDAVKDEKSRETFVEILLKVYKDNKTGVSIDRDNLKGIVVDILVGGIDTTSATLEWTMTELLRNPKVLTKLQKEVREILKGKQVISDGDLEKMHYLKAVVKETLRYHTPAPFIARVARENAKVMGFDIKAGTLILINAWAISRDSASWIEPEKFNPERFMNSSIDFKGQDFELIPFGAGRRGCPGITFAMASVELVLANLVQKFEWELPNGTKVEGLDIIEHPGIIIHRKNPLIAVATHCYF